VNVGKPSPFFFFLLSESLDRCPGWREVSVDARPRVVLFNPDYDARELLIPGLLVISVRIMGCMCRPPPIVREKESGTLGTTVHDTVSAMELVRARCCLPGGSGD